MELHVGISSITSIAHTRQAGKRIRCRRLSKCALLIAVQEHFSKSTTIWMSAIIRPLVKNAITAQNWCRMQEDLRHTTAAKASVLTRRLGAGAEPSTIRDDGISSIFRYVDKDEHCSSTRMAVNVHRRLCPGPPPYSMAIICLNYHRDGRFYWAHGRMGPVWLSFA
jgi:hypothetical protein